MRNLAASNVETTSPKSYSPDVPSFGENVRTQRERRGMKSLELAELLDVAPSVVSAWENDRRGLPETPTLLKLAKALNCTIDELLSGVDAEYDRIRERAIPRTDAAGRVIATTETELIERWQLLKPETRDSLQKVIWELTEDAIHAAHAKQTA